MVKQKVVSKLDQPWCNCKFRLVEDLQPVFIEFKLVFTSNYLVHQELMLKSSSTPAPNQIFINIRAYQLFLNLSTINILSLIIFCWREGLSYT